LILLPRLALGAWQNQSGPPARSATPPQALAEAQSALSHGDADDAIRILSSYLETKPQDSSAHIMLGQAYALSGQNDRAEVEFESALKIAPDNSIALAALAELYNRGGAPEKAEPLLAHAVKVSHGMPELRMEWAVVLARLHKYKEAESALAGLAPPSNPDQLVAYHRLKASVALGLGDSAAAAASMEKALALKPADPSLAMATAVAELQSKNAKRAANLAEPVYARTHNPEVGFLLLQAELEAKIDFRSTLDKLRATQLPPSEQLAFHQHLAALLISNGKYSTAIEELKAAADLDPTRPDLQYNLALAQFRAGQLEDAERSAEKCKVLGDDADLEDLIGDIQEARGDNLGAVKSYQAAVTLAPNEEKYRLSLAVELIRHSNIDAARVVLKQAEESQPNSWRIQLASGMVEYFGGTDDEATRYLLHASELAPDSQVALKYLGDIQIERASAPDPAALQRLCDSSDRDPKNGQLQYYCGAVLFRRDYLANDKSHADEILKRLRASETLLPKNDSPHCQLGKAYRWLDRWQEALSESKTCARMDPNSADAHYRLAQIYQHLGQRELAQTETKLYETASEKVADENARRQAALKTFIYTIQNETPDQK
jgi:Flp pilus assembly protein TadD